QRRALFDAHRPEVRVDAVVLAGAHLLDVLGNRRREALRLSVELRDLRLVGEAGGPRHDHADGNQQDERRERELFPEGAGHGTAYFRRTLLNVTTVMGNEDRAPPPQQTRGPAVD